MSKQENYTIRRSKRAKRARIIVTEKAVELVAPTKMPMKLLREFADSHSEWISATQNKIQQKSKNMMRIAPESYKEGCLLQYLGDKYPLSIQFKKCAQINITLDESFNISLPLCLKEGGEQALNNLVRQTYLDWLWQQSLKQVILAAETYAKVYQLKPRSIRVREQKSRWGSCGIHDDIYMNWLLILAPVAVLEYVVIHEICHIKHRNHSKDFWQLVALHCPKYKIHRAWLKEHGTSLMQGI
ncbi:MAG: SprT family zinc-dependent metalloprotease [Methyloprofundus sp.]|nr:SprT family zinc-dependent metalloprotease [Methyloprofundus sp.]